MARKCTNKSVCCKNRGVHQDKKNPHPQGETRVLILTQCYSRLILAERVGFEPTVRQRRTLDFESSAFDHSATFPDSVVCGYELPQSAKL
ncbi:MAG: hypothetical protein V7606_2607 [Burkholderiales bacterium]